MKKINFITVIFIVLVATLLGIGFNIFSDKGIALIPKKQETVSDSLLESGINSGDKIGESVDAEGEKIVSYEQIKNRIGDPNFLIIDARNSEDYNESHIGDAINIFPHDPEHEVMEKLYQLPQDKKIIIYCTGGNCNLSHSLAEMLRSTGQENIFIYTGGWDEWVKRENIQ